MKKLLLLIILISVASCKTKSNIITSKEEAKEKGVYSYSDKKKAAKTEMATDSKNTLENSVPQSKLKAFTVSKSINSLANQIVEKAIEFLGFPYEEGGTTPKGMDCSGLVFNAYGSYNIVLPRTSYDMSLQGEMISTTEAQAGDLIFFMTNGKKVVNHVGLIVEVAADEIKFIHSSTTKGVIISSTLDDYYGKTFAQINRVLKY